MPRHIVQRQLSAILVADVVGYSSLMGRDEMGALSRLKSHLLERFEPLVATHHGRIIKLMGDGVLVEYASVVDAVECAVAIQYAVSEHEANAPNDERIRFRIAVHLGDIIIEKDDIFGDAVNIASRLEGIAEPGGICLSQQAYDQIEGKLGLTFTDIGAHELKNIARAVHVYKIEIGSSETVVASRADIMARPAVAVLPFENMSGDKEQDYFADGLTEDLITALSYWRSFPVIARTSTFNYKGQSVDVKRVGRELGARYVLEGSVRKSGNRVRITAQFVDAETGHQLWAERFDRALEDVFELQDELTQRITATIEPELEQAELRRASTKRPENLNAWNCYLRGMALIAQQSCESNNEARKMFARAITLDSTYSDAWAGLTLSYVRDIREGCTNDISAALTRAFEAGHRAVALDQASSAAHFHLGTAYIWAERHDLAIVETELAIRLNPSNAHACMGLGNRLDLAGQTEEGIEKMEQSLQLNPRDPNRATYMGYLARAYINSGDNDKALAWARNMFQLHPNRPDAHYRLAICLANLDQVDEARKALAECEHLHPGFLSQRADWRPYSDDASNERFFAGAWKYDLISRP